MPLRVDNIEITQLYVDNKECKVLYINNEPYFGKKYALTQNSSTGVTLSVQRTESPYQRASMGYISAGQAIYYGDKLTISVAATSNYTNPKLYVNIGDGNGLVLRSSPFSFTVTDNVTFYGTATVRGWRTLWSGTRTFTWTDTFSIAELADCSDVEITATAVFNDYYVEPSTYERYNGNQYNDSCNRRSLTVTLRGCNSGITIAKNGGQLDITFYDNWEESKGYYLYEQPTSLTITEVRGI